MPELRPFRLDKPRDIKHDIQLSVRKQPPERHISCSLLFPHTPLPLVGYSEVRKHDQHISGKSVVHEIIDSYYVTTLVRKLQCFTSQCLPYDLIRRMRSLDTCAQEMEWVRRPDDTACNTTLCRSIQQNTRQRAMLCVLCICACIMCIHNNSLLLKLFCFGIFQ